MWRQLPFWLLVGTVLAVGVFFFHVVQPFLFPLFFAGVLAILFRPLYEKTTRFLRGHRRFAAALATLLVLLLAIAPMSIVSIKAGQDLIELGGKVVQNAENSGTDPALKKTMASLRQQLTDDEFARLREAVLKGEKPTSALPSPNNSEAFESLGELEYKYSQSELIKWFEQVSVSDILEPNQHPRVKAWLEKFEPYVSSKDLNRLQEVSRSALQGLISDIYNRTRAAVANVINFVVGFAVMTLALYYFFADGPQFLRTLQRAIPLEDADEEALFQQFDLVCRGVVLGSMVSAVAQAVLVGAGLAVVGVGKIWLLSGLTLFFSLIPFLGAAAVYLPVAGYLAFQGRYGSALFLAVYGGGLVSTSDNLIRAYVLHGKSRLHPLVALVSVLGGLKVIGLWGIFVGPIVASVFYALLKIVQQKLERAEQAPHDR